MDHDEQVKDLVEQSRQIFLRDESQRYTKRELYNLHEEFAKTRKNKNPIVWIAVLLFVAVFATGAILLTMYIQNESQRVPIDIADFADVNLKDVLDKAKKLENQKRTLERELQDLIDAMNKEIGDVNRKAEQDIGLINARAISQAEKNNLIQIVRNQENRDVKAIEQKYQPLIQQKQAELAAVQKEIDEYDTKLTEQAKKQEEILNNQQKKFDLEMAKTIEYYEDQIKTLKNRNVEEVNALKAYNASIVDQLNRNHAAEIERLNREHADEIARLKAEHAEELRVTILKFNPIYDSYPLRGIISRGVTMANLNRNILHSYRAVLNQENIVGQADFNYLQGYISDYDTLVNEFQKVPYENSVPGVLQQLENLTWLMVQAYENMWYRMSLVLETKNEKLAQYAYAFTSLIRTSRENGYVLDPRDTKNMVIFVDTGYDIKDGDLAYIFRKDDQPIGTIRFNRTKNGKGESLSASLTELVSADVPVEPFDKILLQVK